MANGKTICFSKESLEKEGVVVLPLRKWRVIEEDLEDLEMYRSVLLASEIARRRKEKKSVSLEKVLKKYNI